MGVLNSKPKHGLEGKSMNPFHKTYHEERKEVRRTLILGFLADEENKQILEDIHDLRTLIVLDKELCATAQREWQRKYDVSPTCMAAAEYELLRLLEIFERGKYLKSAVAREGAFVACPYGHVAKKFEADTCPPCYTAGTVPICGICQRGCLAGGYTCEFCEYNLCDVCCVVYCAEGHAMKLWTLGEGDYVCGVCRTDPINAGYHCNKCIVDMCDLCTYIPGRLAVQAYQLAEMEDLVDFMRPFVEQSWTAKMLVQRHDNPLTRDKFMRSTLTINEYVTELRIGKDSCQEQVKQYRIWEEVVALRLEIAKENNAVARRELKNVGNFTELEITRLKRVIAVSARARSVYARRMYTMGCPVGHYMGPFKGTPPAWYKLDKPPLCAVCERVATQGTYCPICEYGLCDTCSIVYCFEGHEMVMWTEPEVAINITCMLCKTENIKAGYHCNTCDTDLCDACTSKERREELRLEKAKELSRLCQLITKYQDRSDMAYSYKKKKIPYITSMKMLVEYLAEMRWAMDIAERQFRYYTYICKMKSLRRRITKYSALCASAKREEDYKNPYNFHNKREVKRELDRLKNTIDTQRFLASVTARSRCPIACPLGHCLNFIVHSTGVVVNTQPDLMQRRLEMEQAKNEAAVAAGNLEASAVPSIAKRLREEAKAAAAAEEAAAREAAGEPEPVPESEAEPAMDSVVASVEGANGVGSSSAEGGEGAEGNDFLGMAMEAPEGENGAAEEAKGAGQEQEGGESGAAGGDGADDESLEELPAVDVSSFHTQAELEVKRFVCAVCDAVLNPDSTAAEHNERMQQEADAAMAAEVLRQLEEAEDLEDGQMPPPAAAADASSCETSVVAVGAKNGPVAGRYCAFCDYTLCNMCCTVYCRQGHECTLWTVPAAVNHDCNVCYAPGITAGYNCPQCAVDLCDLCTTRDTRNVLLMLPKREFKQHYAHLQHNRSISKTANLYLAEHTEERVAVYMQTMSILCGELRRLQQVRGVVDAEIALHNEKYAQRKYAVKSNDL